MNQIHPRLKLPPSIHAARRTDDLDAASRLLVRSYRSWIKGLKENDCRSWNEVWNGFTAALGTRDGKQALTWFVRMINVIREHAGRTVRFHQPGCPCLGDDERAFLGLVAACRDGRALVARSHADSLVRPEGVCDLLGAAGQLALVLALPDPILDQDEIFAEIDLHAMTPPTRTLN